MQKGFFQNQAQNCSAFFKKKLGDNGNPIVKLFTETYLSKKVCCFIFHSSNATVQKLLPVIQIREQMSGPDLHVFTLKFLALKTTGFSPIKDTSQFFLDFCLHLFYAIFQCGS